MLVNCGGLVPQLFVLVGADVLTLIFEPALNLVHGTQDSSELISAEVSLSKTVSSFADRLLKPCLQTVEQVTELRVCLGAIIFSLTEENRGVDVREVSMQ